MTTTVNNEHKNIKVPNLRFPEFQGEWEEERLADIADLYKGTGISKDQLSDDGEPYWHSCISPWQYNHVIQRS